VAACQLLAKYAVVDATIDIDDDEVTEFTLGHEQADGHRLFSLSALTPSSFLSGLSEQTFRQFLRLDSAGACFYVTKRRHLRAHVRSRQRRAAGTTSAKESFSKSRAVFRRNAVPAEKLMKLSNKNMFLATRRICVL
jgi:hypothetical protein